MSAAVGALVGLLLAVGLLLVLDGVLITRRTSVAVRVAPYLRDLPQSAALPSYRPPATFVTAVFGPVLRRAGAAVERVLGGADSVRRRLVRADLDLEVSDFRIQQVVWGMCAFVAVAVPSALIAAASPQRSVPLLIFCLLGFVLGVLVRENRLSSQVATRERRILEEFPTVAELLALSVAAGEGPVGALDRVVTRTHGALAGELRGVLSQIRTGTPVTEAFDQMAARTGLPVVARFAEGIAIAIERGTPLTEVLHAQAGDVREAGRRALIESGARREVAMMVPVVFLVLPTVVVFAFWPGLVGLNLVVP